MSGFLGQAASAGATLLGVAEAAAFQQSFDICPIFLSGGIAGSMQGGLMPITALTQPFPPAEIFPSLDDYFAHFYPLPGSTLIDNKIGEYPFANQSVAANAIITQPLRISMRMVCPSRASTGGLVSRLPTITSLRAALAQHSQLGGMFTVATPSFIWPNTILERLADISTGDTKQVQTEWQFDFVQPLVTLAQASAAMNNQMSKIASGVQTDGSSSGQSVSVGNQNTNTQPYVGGMAGFGQ